MGSLSIQQVSASRFRTSQNADEMTMELYYGLGLSSKANVARLAIGRSLSMGPLIEDSIDSKGREIPASSLFHQEDIPVWIGMIVTHSLIHNGKTIKTMDDFRIAVRKHWHRGVELLMEDWQTNDGNYNKFIETLINRRANLPEEGPFCILDNDNKKTNLVKEEQEDVSERIIKALVDVGISAEIKGHINGPRMTRYKIYLKNVNQLDKLRRNLEPLSLILNTQNSVPTVSPGDQTRTVFLDVPRPKSSWKGSNIVNLKEWVENTTDFDSDTLVLYPGVDIIGKPFSFELSAAPHLLVGGATGQGKSVCLHALILSLILRHSPSNLKLALIDPKQVEFSVYQKSKFLYKDRVAMGTDDANDYIDDLILEMDKRYEDFKNLGVTNIVEARQNGMDLPFIAVFIEELADLVLKNRDLENKIVRLAQLARASGIHLVLATQRPDSKTFSGLIRSNITARIALTVQKSSESSIILDETGAENLLGAGDMIIKIPGSHATRVHGVNITRKDVEKYI